MTKDEALKLALEALISCELSNNGRDWVWPVTAHEQAMKGVKEAITAIKEALAQPDHIRDATKMMAQPEQEPVARVIDNGTPEGATEWIPFANRIEPLKTGDLLYTHADERNFCPRCGKRTADLTTIHTCTPPQEKDA